MPDTPDYAAAVDGYVTAAKSMTAAGTQANPDEAARNVQLESSTGVSSQVIGLDQEAFEQYHKSALASQLVASNPELMAYVHSHPMAAAVSGDDWGALSEFSNGAKSTREFLDSLNTPLQRVAGAAGEGALQGFKEGFGDYPQFFPQRTAAGNLVQSASVAAQLALQFGGGVFSATTQGLGEAARAAAEELGVKDAVGFGKSISELAEYHMISPGGDWVAAHQEPPRGVNAGVDGTKAMVNAHVLEKLEEDLANAQSSATKERSPELFTNFVRQHYGNATIGIHGDAVAQLYGDKPPGPDDGKLGWVPGIADKLDLARETGADVEVPVADWIAKVDPALAKELHDDIRVWPGGITAREAGEAKVPEGAEEGVTKEQVQAAPQEYPQVVDSPLAQVRGAAGMEPMFSIGDRKLQLVKESEDVIPTLKDGVIVDEPVHVLQILDENGQPVGEVHVTPKGKDLEVGWIGGVAGQWANNFGPSLIMDLKRQLKALYPEAETLSGFRISGARKEAGAVGPITTVKLSGWATPVEGTGEGVPSGWDIIEPMQRILADAYRPVDAGVEANLHPSSVFLSHEKELAGAVHDELTKITSGRANIVPTAGIRYGVARPTGMYFGRSSLILYDLLGQDPMGTARHEAIHFLRDQGLFSDKEWDTLTTAAKEEGWAERYHIPQRYDELYAGNPRLEEMKAEESVAEAFREWAGQAEDARRTYSPVARIFQKLLDFLNGLKVRFTEIFGHEPSAAELFEKTASGEIGQRAMQGTAEPRSATPMFSAEDLDNLKASGLGLDLKTFQRIQRLVQERHKSDVEASVRVAEREQARRQTKEWKDNKATMAQEVETTIRQRPDVAADLFVGSGEYNGEKLRQRFTLRSSDLTAEQKEGLPAHYVSTHGLPVDEVGRLFGYPSGDAMVDRLAAYNALKGDRSPQEMLRHVIDTEADRQMEAKYGKLQENILQEAQDQALAQNDLNILHEDYQAAAMQAGVQAVGKEEIEARAKDLVSQLPLNEIDYAKQMTQIGRHYRDAVRSLAAGDPASTVGSLQKRTLAAFTAAEMRRVEKERAQFERVTKRYAKAWDPTKTAAVSPDFSLFIRQALSQVGLRYGMSVPGLAKAISESGFTDLVDFVTKTEDEGKVYGLELPVPEWLLNPTLQAKPKTYPTMTVGEFRELRDGITAMDKVGRADQKVIRSGEAQDRTEWIGKAVSQLHERFPVIPLEKTKQEGLRHAVNTFVATLTSNETLMSRFDGRDTHGLFTETITKPGAEAANRKARLQRETAEKYRELGKIKDAEKTLASPFRDPRTGSPIDFTRKNLAAVISNMGNNYNWSVLAKGWGLDPDALWKWVESVSTKEDIERAQGLGGIFKGLKSEADMEYQHLYGIAPENVVPRPFEMHGKKFEGWYHPIIGDPQLSRFVNKMPDPGLEQNFWPSTSNSYMRRRTGANQVIDLTYDSVPARMDQVIHDISFRAFVANTAKIFRDERFRAGVRAHYGKPYMEEMDKWLQSLAGDSSYNSSAMRLASRLSNQLRQNVITTQIAFNLGTVEKHGLTAALMSANELSPNLLRSLPQFTKVTAEVAPSLFQRAVRDMFGKSPELGQDLFSFIKSNSEEIQRRERNFLDTLGGSQNYLEGQQNLRGRLSQAGAKMVAFSDMLSAAPLWLAKYRAEFEANGGVHGDAVREADMAVRRAHGSTAITNLPSIARGSGPVTPWLTSLYGFMGTSMQRRIEIFHDLNDAGNLAMNGQIREASKMIPAILSNVGVYVLYTGLVEELITSQFTQDKRGFGYKALSFLFGTAAQSIIGLRDLVYDLETGRESAGLISTPINDMQHLLRDVRKKDPLGKAHAGQLIENGCTVIGDLFGLCPKHLGTIGHYGLDVFSGFAQPRDLGDVYRGALSGSQKQRVER